MTESAYLGIVGCDRIALRVLRYQFPGHARDGDRDSNWLTIEGAVERIDDRWSFVDPCLLTSEAAQLVQWLRALPESPAQLDFVEPLLCFRRGMTDDPWTFDVTLRAEAVPDSAGGEARWTDGISLRITTSAAQRDHFVRLLESDLAKFPPR
jgi:hypothetical protein